MRRRTGASLGVVLAAASLASGVWVLASVGTAGADTLTFNCTGVAQT